MHDRRSPFLTDEKLINLLITRLKYCKFFGKSCSGFSLPNFSFSTFHSHPDTKSFIIIIISILPKKLKHSSTTAHSHNNLFSDEELLLLPHNHLLCFVPHLLHNPTLILSASPDFFSSYHILQALLEGPEGIPFPQDCALQGQQGKHLLRVKVN